MNLSDILTSNEDIHSLFHNRTSSNAKRHVEATEPRLRHILMALHRCIEECGQNIPQISPEEELALMAATVQLIDDAIEQVTSRKPS